MSASHQAILLQVQALHPAAAQGVLLDLPGLLFFSTYTLLVLFWAEIYHQACNIPTSTLRPAFMAFNAAVYAVQVRSQSVFWSMLTMRETFCCAYLCILVTIACTYSFCQKGCCRDTLKTPDCACVRQNIPQGTLSRSPSCLGVCRRGCGFSLAFPTLTQACRACCPAASWLLSPSWLPLASLSMAVASS